MGLTHGGQWRTVRHCDPLQEPTELLELVSEHKEGLMSTAMASFFQWSMWCILRIQCHT